MPLGQQHPSPSTAHRKKSPFQPSITSFFAPRCDSDLDSSDDQDDYYKRGPIGPPRQSASAAKYHRRQLQTQLPGSVQADLLSVGMRVRKSVPEGYKTHKTSGLPSIHTTISSRSSASITAAAEYSVKPPRDPVPEQVQHQRELLPFCGLHKIGGYAEQPVTNVHLYGGSDPSGERSMNIFPLPAEAFTQPFSSQSSTDSSISNSSLAPNPANLHKRSWHDEDETPVRLSSNFLFKIPMKVAEDDVPISPLSATPPQGIAFPQPPLRPFAQPKTRRAGISRTMDVDGMVIKEGDVDMDLENTEQAEGRVLVGSPGDFEDAEFLRPWSGSREVDMGGI